MPASTLCSASQLLPFTSILPIRSEEHTSELQSPCNIVCRLLLEKKKIITNLNFFIHVYSENTTESGTPASSKPSRTLLTYTHSLSVFQILFIANMCLVRHLNSYI